MNINNPILQTGGNMKTAKFVSIMIMVILATAPITSCGLPSLKPTPTPLPTDTATLASTPTRTLVPTATHTLTPTLIPSATANATGTAQYNGMFEAVTKMHDEGYIPSADGNYAHVEDYSNQWAQLGWYQWTKTGWKPQDFVLKAHLKWVSDTKTPNPSGCGILFHVQPTDEHYVVFVYSIGYIEAGIMTDKLRSLGYSYFGPSKNEGEADFMLSVVGTKFDVFINGKHIKGYTGLQGKMDSGELAFTTLSGTNAGFGTECDITQADLWMLK
jgi:hypothetical protein